MPTYNDLRPTSDFEDRDFELVFPEMTDAVKIRTIDGLLALKSALAGLRPRRSEENLLIASWNIKEFGHTTQRLPEAYYYIAEVIARFDVVAIQEVKSTLKDLDIVMRLLGDHWRYLVNDITEGGDGNSERSAYLYNTERVSLGGLAGELVAWNDLVNDLGVAVSQLKRTPYITGFKAGWKKFALVSVHLQPSKGDGNAERRRDEVRLLTGMLGHKFQSDALWNENLVLLGDFNLYDNDPGDTSWRLTDAATVQHLANEGYTEIQPLVGVDTNISETEAYDRFFVRKSELFSVADENGHEHGGMFDPFEHVFQLGDEATYETEMKAVYGGGADLDVPAELTRYYKDYWRKNQISDHLPIWFELSIDSSRRFLTDKREALAGD